MSDNQGNWRSVGLSGVVGIHAALLHTGQVLFYARPEFLSSQIKIDNGLPNNNHKTTLSTIIDLSNLGKEPHIVPVQENPFCSGLTFLSDGCLFVAGGDKKYDPKFENVPPSTSFEGRYSLRTFTPGVPNTANHGQWQEVGTMSDARWYPTCTLLPDGRVFIISGYLDDMVAENNQNPTCEIYPPLPNGPQYLSPLVDAWPHDAYPFVFVLPYGSVFLFVKDRAYDLRLERDKFGRERWMIKGGEKLPPEDYKEEPAKHYPNSATAVLLPLLPEKAYTAEVLIIGGGGINVHLHWNFHHVDACDNCFRMQVDPPLNPEIKEIKPQWQKIKMPNKRVMPDAVLLPDGTVLVVNGTSKGFAGGDAGTGPMQSSDAVKGVDLYNSLTNTWYSLATTDIPRLYHSTALLLPDATVLIAGSDHQSRDTTLAYEYRIEVFEPPYLFIGAERATRPVIKTDKNSVMYKQQFQIEVDGLTDMRREDLRIALLRPGSVTHSNNMSQRYVGLSIVDQSQTHLTLEAPPNGNIAPPGYYMLFLLHGRVPSEAQFIQLLPGTSTEPTDNLPSTTGMEIWLRADVGIGAVNNGSVFSWSDTSGKGNDVFLKKNVGVGEPIQQPPKWVHNELNGYPVVRFSIAFNTDKSTPLAYGGCLESKNQAFLPGSSPYTVFCVTHPWPQGVKLDEYKVGSVGWGDLVGWGDYTQAHSNAFVGLRLGPSPTLDKDSLLPRHPGKASILNYWATEWEYGLYNKIVDAEDPLIPLSSAVLIEMFYNGVNTGMRINGNLIKDDPAPAGGRNTGNGPLTIGLNSGLRYNAYPLSTTFKGAGAFFRGDIAEIIIYERNIEGKERYEIQEYLRNKYSLW